MIGHMKFESGTIAKKTGQENSKNNNRWSAEEKGPNEGDFS